MTDDLCGDNPLDDLAEDFARRWREGERPSVEDYAEQYPRWADEIRAVLPGVVLMEQLKPCCNEGAQTGPPVPVACGTPERLGEYRIIREIGRGGMGVVYEAEHEALGRRVALKVLPRQLLANEKSRSRFRRESRAAARLHHTNIVPIFGVGESDEDCFYVMQLVDGQGLDQVIRSAGFEPKIWCRTAARIGLQVAEALAFAHTHGVLHRDIKPSNLLLDSEGAVWVTDFGVAKVVEEANLTQSGELVGTLKYMAPEQFSGHSDARCDVYSLGVTLYELLTLRSAFPDTTPQHLIQLITHTDPIQPRKVNPAVPKDLNTIVQKAASRDPAHRYQTASELADDLRRFLDDRPILARRPGLAEQTWRWCRRNPSLATATATAFLLMVAVTIVSVVAYAQTAAANHETAKALAAEMAQREHAENASTLALEALNRIFYRFAPTRLVVTPQASNAQGVELPLQPALPPEAIALMEDLLRTYEQIAHSGEQFPRLRAQAAEANHRIGEICRRLGRFEDAATAYRAAIDLYTKLPLDSAEGSVRIMLARAYNELGWTLRTLQQFDEADPMYERAIRTVAEAPKELARRPEYRFELARASFLFGQRDPLNSPRGPGPQRPPPHESKHPPEFRGGPPPDRPPGQGPRHDREHPAQRAASLVEELVRDFPKVPEYRHLLACCYRDIPPERVGRGPAATKSKKDTAVEILEQLVADFPRVPDYQLDLCETLARPGPGEQSEKRERLKKALALSASLVSEYPNIPDYAAAHARYLDQRGVLLFLDAKTAEAETLFRQALAIQHKLVKQYPEVVAYGIWLSLMERSLGRALNERGAWPEAKAQLEAAIERMQSLGQKDRRLGAVRPLLGVAYLELAQALKGAGETARAAVALRKSRDFEAERAQDPFCPR